MSLRITALSPFICATPRAIVEQISIVESGLVVLPGWRRNGPSLVDLQQALQTGVTLFAELGPSIQRRKAYLVTCEANTQIPDQVFAERPSLSALSKLAGRLPERTIKLGSHRVVFFLCGEIHAFDANGTPKADVELPFEVLINPAHSMMGRWRVLGQKLEALSRGRVVVHVANNYGNNHRVSTDVRIYADGKQVGERIANGYVTWSTFEVVNRRRSSLRGY